ncbi:MAG: tetraacyldisaccharide 4'-kinase [Planctomycetota bacterium]|jgi:tetraacyldisaccharide 4'-kinase
MSKPPWEFPLWGPIFSPIGALYGAFMTMRRRRFASGASPQHRFAVPVISVGNLTVGGVGKTPMVAKILTLLESQDGKCVLSRGYGAQVAESGLNDESHMLQQQFPDTMFVQGKDRVAAALKQAKEAQVFILDDGAQHLRINRDLEILVFDTASLSGPRFTLPAGPWRENLLAAASADFLFLSRSDEVDEETRLRATKVLSGLFPDKPVFETKHETVGLSDAYGNEMPLESLRGHSVLAVSAIGKPVSFATSLERLGADVIGRLEFRDHAPFGPAERQRIIQSRCDLGAEFLVTTEKDVAKIMVDFPSEDAERLRVLRVELDLGAGEEPIKDALRDLGLI